MDSRWRFLRRHENDAMTQKDTVSRVMVNPVVKRGRELVKYGSRKGEVKTRAKSSSETRKFRLARKVAGILKWRPYHKPTQVG
jgi:ribosomal protein S15P/S13E